VLDSLLVDLVDLGTIVEYNSLVLGTALLYIILRNPLLRERRCWDGKENIGLTMSWEEVKESKHQ